MGICSKGAAEAKPTAAEIALVETAFKGDRRYVSKFLGVEKDALADVTSPGSDRIRQLRRDILSARNQGDVAQAEQAALATARNRALASGTTLASGANQAAIQRANESVAAASLAGNVDADQATQAIEDAERVGVVRTGRNLARAAQTGLSNQARLSSARAQNAVLARAEEQAARNQMLGKLTGLTVAGGYSSFRDARNPDLDPSEISLAARGLRGMGLGPPTPSAQTTSPFAFHGRRGHGNPGSSSGYTGI